MAWHLSNHIIMKHFKLSLIIISLSFLGTACTKWGEATPNCISVTGQIEKQGVTSYMYGTHTIKDYALRSDIYDLDEFVHEPIVMIEGCFIKGYQNGAVEGGPDYLEVIAIAIQ